MSNVVRMPEIATGAEEAGVQSWLVSRGDTVEVGQAIVEIETEKAVVEFESEFSGVFAGELLAAGEETAVGSPIAVIAAAGEDLDDALAAAGASASEDTAGATGDPHVSASSDKRHGEAVNASEPERKEESASIQPHLPEEVRLFASPLVRRIAREKGLDLANINGTGPHGRIVRRDVQEHIAQLASESRPQPESIEEASTPAEANATSEADPRSAIDKSDESFTDVAHTAMRKAIARRLTESKGTVPHFYLAADCQVDALLGLRKQVNELGGTRVSVNDFIVKAVAGALTDVPAANAIWTDSATRRFHTVDIAVAVSVPDGLITPVVRSVERQSLGNLSREISDLATRARDGKIRQHELEGGSFSVSNLGMYGTSEFSAILNPPQSGILAVGAAQKRPCVDEAGELGVATVMTVTLSADHRVIDGALAAEWLAAFQKRIEEPMSLLV